MIENVTHLQRYIHSKVLLDAGVVRYSLIGMVVIGSAAYPEFARANSDIDLLVIVESEALATLPHETIEHLGFQTWPAGPRLIECRIFTISAFSDYVLSCDVAKSYAFVRGFEIVFDTNDTVANLITLGLNRFWTECFTLYNQLARLNLAGRIQNTRFHFTDARNYIVDGRIQQQSLLSSLRTAEIVKDYLIQLFTLLIARQVQAQPRIGFDPEHPLLKQCGFLLALSGAKGARMTDTAKYPNHPMILDIFNRIGAILRPTRGVAQLDCLLKEMDYIFQEHFAETLWITQAFAMNYQPFR
jgi:hypothetical protein